MIYRILKLLGFRKCWNCGKLLHTYFMVYRRFTDDWKDEIGYKAYVCKYCSGNLDNAIE